MESVGFGSFRIPEVRKTFRDITSAWELLLSPSIEIHGFEWYVGIENKENESFGIYLCREYKEK